MDLEKLIEMIAAFKANHTNSTIDFLVHPQRDLDDKFAELLIVEVLEDSEGNTTIGDEEALMTVDNPSTEDLSELENIAQALHRYL
ncbi:Hypothetical protein Tpal_253 [Trichococcus palustris]|jgi:hypothetical protein|uniref:Uncharacterized protein n=1 Tax=Trichococcus palustris TaxID=140314 RepID=A0A143Y7R1_9LACT|nr:hypothetical protein [Trichococcus palustris]CZQ81878.1 Hypothetical protein Tpal_253 [Trichococcus palustris]SFK61518.1 hypothetical protein SAMN04488076_10237 [Trichococcus palustris]